MADRPNRTLAAVALALTASSLVLAAWMGVSHFHRDRISDQTRTWHDGVETFRFYRSPADSFEPALYEEIRSVDDGVAHLSAGSKLDSEKEILHATYDLVRRRFLHFPYPHHTWRTNPLLAAMESLVPTKQYDWMAPADVKLRHSAVAPCGDAAQVFIEIYRAMGGRARMVSFQGPSSHQIAEAIADGRTYMVDADLEALIPMSVAEFAADSTRMSIHYSHRSQEDRDLYRSIFSGRIDYTDYDGLPCHCPRAYRAQVFLERTKVVGPILIAALFAWIAHRAGAFRTGAL